MTDVSDADRKAVAAFQAASFEALFRNSGPAKPSVNEAHKLLAQAFAQHRLTAERDALERAAEAEQGDCQDGDPCTRAYERGRLAGMEQAAVALEADAKLCDCSAYEENECACGAWCEWKTITSARAVEIVRAAKGEGNGYLG